MYYSLIAELVFYLLVGRVVRRYWRLYSPSSVLDVAFGFCALVAFTFYKLRVVISVAIFLARAGIARACGAKDLHDAHRQERLQERLALTNKNVQEENKSSGFHLFELHVPTMGTTMGFFTLIFVAAIAFAWYYLSLIHI